MPASRKPLLGSRALYWSRCNIFLLLVAAVVVIVGAQRYLLGALYPCTSPVSLWPTGGAAGDMSSAQLDSSYQRVITSSLPETLSQLLRGNRVVTILGCNNPWLRSAQVPNFRSQVVCVDTDCGLLAAGAAKHWQQGQLWHYQCLSPQVTGHVPPNSTYHCGIIQYSAPQLLPDSLVIMHERKKPVAASLLEAAAMMDRPRLQTVVAETAAGNLTHLLVRQATSQRHTLFEPSHNEHMRAFAWTYAHKKWGDFGNGSGPGSTINNTKSVRRELVHLLKDLGINSMLDSSCGGMAWMPMVIEEVRRFNPKFRYLGMDVACPLIQQHQQTFRTKSNYMSFTCSDASHEPMPQGYDLIFSRDSLQHLPIRDAYAFLHNVVQSKAQYLLVGSYLRLPRNENKNLAAGGALHYNINLLAMPFWLRPAPLRIINETDSPPSEPMKSLLLFQVDKLHWAEPLDGW